jgi:prophage regulatory protein
MHNTALNHLSQSAYIRLPEILNLLPIGRSTWWQWVATGKAPKGIKLGAKTTAWKLSDIQKLLDDLSKDGSQQ